ALSAKLPAGVPVLDIWNKRDAVEEFVPLQGLLVSARTGDGLQALRQALLEQAGWLAAPEGVYIARQRHVQALERVDGHLVLAAEHLEQRAQALDLLAEELRLGQNALNDITGEFSADDLLGVIFSSFCIGK
ncbi:MAG: tRNA uridine-5-carboxymethylaminomethyl(34) synthesis GTPase MnmE, partial [Burkholderiales bacterium]